ncbi:MAG: hypothetical protein IJG65_09585 [Synergistaceae bacterium]|nr:hypothetical protein [Synergistaceae bacterium]
MTTDAYTLEFPRENVPASTSRSPAVVMLCSVSYALAVSVSDSLPALVLASVLPLMLVVSGKFTHSHLLKLNALNAVMTLTLALTWPEFRGGLIMGMLIALRMNMIYVAFSSFVLPLGTSGVYSALVSLGIPEKLRVLILLTLRGIHIMHGRFSAALVSVRLRAPGLRGLAKLRVFAYITASVLIQSSERSENMVRSVKCRGGFRGFMQSESVGLSSRDAAMIAGFMFYVAGVMVLNYA